jgi:hypothetical protein
MSAAASVAELKNVVFPVFVFPINPIFIIYMKIVVAYLYITMIALVVTPTHVME